MVDPEVSGTAARLRGEVDAALMNKVERTFRETVVEETRMSAKQVATELTSRIQNASLRAHERVLEMVESADEDVATKNAHFIINHTLGTPMQKSISRTEHVNIDILAD